MSSKPTIVICSSMAFYRHANVIADELRNQGLHVIVPENAIKMKQSGNYDPKAYSTWFKNPNEFKRKGELMRTHFDKITKADAILVVNDEKHGIAGYIGPNVLLEMGLAFYLGKTIFVLNPVGDEARIYEEVLGMGSIILNGDLSQIGA